MNDVLTGPTRPKFDQADSPSVTAENCRMFMLHHWTPKSVLWEQQQQLARDFRDFYISTKLYGNYMFPGSFGSKCVSAMQVCQFFGGNFKLFSDADLDQDSSWLIYPFQNEFSLQEAFYRMLRSIEWKDGTF